jgi:hypothetical protein
MAPLTLSKRRRGEPLEDMNSSPEEVKELLNKKYKEKKFDHKVFFLTNC